MSAFKQMRDGAITIHGNGRVGGKGEGLLFLEGLQLPKAAARLRTEILTTQLYRRYMENCQQLDSDTVSYLGRLHASLGDQPISVRPSEMDENDPDAATSGANTSFMLPNNHPDPATRFGQFMQAIRHVFAQFTDKAKREGTEDDGVAIVINPIPGVLDNTPAGLFYYPMSSGVADSIFRYPLVGIEPEDGFGRVAFGHGYAVVTDEIPIIPLLTIEKPTRPGENYKGQREFFAIDMSKNAQLSGADRETMAQLTIRHASAHHTVHFIADGGLNFDNLIGEDRFGYASGLRNMMNAIRACSGAFQIEFAFNIFDGNGVFHIVQYKRLRELRSERVIIPEDNKTVYLSTDRVQGHGIIEGITHAVVVSPFTYRKEQQGEVRRRLNELNKEMRAKNARYILICPGRIGTTNSDWGIYVEFSDISGASVIAEYGYDITGSPVLKTSDSESLGGIYGSHFLWRALGGAREEERVKQMRMLGTQGTHFMTNLMTTGAFYVHVDPAGAEIDPWLFSPQQGQKNAPIFVKEFSTPVTAYADLFERRCVIK